MFVGKRIYFESLLFFCKCIKKFWGQKLYFLRLPREIILLPLILSLLIFKYLLLTSLGFVVIKKFIQFIGARVFVSFTSSLLFEIASEFILLDLIPLSRFDFGLKIRYDLLHLLILLIHVLCFLNSACTRCSSKVQQHLDWAALINCLRLQQALAFYYTLLTWAYLKAWLLYFIFDPLMLKSIELDCPVWVKVNMQSRD